MPFDASALRTAAADGPALDEPPPPDTYEAALTKAESFVARNSGEEWLRLGWKVLTGRLAGHSWSSVHTLEPDRETAYAGTARTVAALGVDLAQVMSLEDLMRALAGMKGSAYSVEVRAGGQGGLFTNPKNRLASYQPEMAPGSGYGQAPAQRPANAIHQGDGPTADGGLLTQAPPRYPERTGQSDVPGAGPDEFVHPESPPKRGDIDPETGQPFPF